MGMVHNLLCLPGPSWAFQGRVLIGTDPNHRPDGQVIRCVKNGLDCQNQRAVISGSVPSGKKVVDEICQRLIIFISYPGNEAGQSLSKFVD